MNLLSKILPLPLGSTNPDQPLFLGDRDRALHYFYKSVVQEFQIDALLAEVERLKHQLGEPEFCQGETRSNAHRPE